MLVFLQHTIEYKCTIISKPKYTHVDANGACTQLQYTILQVNRPTNASLHRYLRPVSMHGLQTTDQVGLPSDVGLLREVNKAVEATKMPTAVGSVRMR